jgi:hypothetical protein
MLVTPVLMANRTCKSFMSWPCWATQQKKSYVVLPRSSCVRRPRGLPLASRCRILMKRIGAVQSPIQSHDHPFNSWLCIIYHQCLIILLKFIMLFALWLHFLPNVFDFARHKILLVFFNFQGGAELKKELGKRFRLENYHTNLMS